MALLWVSWSDRHTHLCDFDLVTDMLWEVVAFLSFPPPKCGHWLFCGRFDRLCHGSELHLKLNKSSCSKSMNFFSSYRVSCNWNFMDLNIFGIMDKYILREEMNYYSLLLLPGWACPFRFAWEKQMWAAQGGSLTGPWQQLIIVGFPAHN